MSADRDFRRSKFVSDRRVEDYEGMRIRVRMFMYRKVTTKTKEITIYYSVSII